MAAADEDRSPAGREGYGQAPHAAGQPRAETVHADGQGQAGDSQGQDRFLDQATSVIILPRRKLCLPVTFSRQPGVIAPRPATLMRRMVQPQRQGRPWRP